MGLASPDNVIHCKISFGFHAADPERLWISLGTFCCPISLAAESNHELNSNNVTDVLTAPVAGRTPNAPRRTLNASCAYCTVFRASRAFSTTSLGNGIYPRSSANFCPSVRPKLTNFLTASPIGVLSYVL